MVGGRDRGFSIWLVLHWRCLWLFAFGQQIVGYDDPHGRVQLALLATFAFGVLIGYRASA